MIVNWFKDLKATYGIIVKFVRCDNSGENNTLRHDCISEDLGIKFEFTAPGTPQQNGVVERGFVTLIGRARAMMNCAGFTKRKRIQMWCEAASCATDLDNILMGKEDTMTKYSAFFGKEPQYLCHLRLFGEMCVTTEISNKKTRTKLDPRGRLSMFIGYSDLHAGDVYRFLHIKTSKVIFSRDTQWLNKTWGEHYKMPNKESDKFIDGTKEEVVYYEIGIDDDEKKPAAIQNNQQDLIDENKDEEKEADEEEEDDPPGHHSDPESVEINVKPRSQRITRSKTQKAKAKEARKTRSASPVASRTRSANTNPKKKHFATYVNQAVKQNKLLYRDAYKITGLKGDTFQKFVNQHLH